MSHQIIPSSVMHGWVIRVPGEKRKEMEKLVKIMTAKVFSNAMKAVSKELSGPNTDAGWLTGCGGCGRRSRQG